MLPRPALVVIARRALIALDTSNTFHQALQLCETESGRHFMSALENGKRSEYGIALKQKCSSRYLRHTWLGA